MSCYFIEDVNLFCVLDESLGNYKSRQPTKLYWESIFHEFQQPNYIGNPFSIFHDFRSEVKEDISFTKKGLDVGNAISQQYAMCLNFEQYIYIYWAQSWNKTWVCTHSSLLFFFKWR